MDASKLVFLLREDARLIRAAYEPITAEMQTAPSAVQPKTYQFKTLDPNISVGDFVVVETGTRHGLTVCKVTEVDLEPDFDDGISLKWAFFSIPVAEIDRIKGLESEAIAVARRAELRKKKEELREAIFRDSEEMKSIGLTTDSAKVTE